MPKFNIRRIVREDTIVEAATAEEAQEIAIANQENLIWDCYDCTYWRDGDDPEEE